MHEFRAGLEPFLKDDHSRPFVCNGSPLKCHAFIVGLNAATRLHEPFSSYWSDEAGFLLKKFSDDYPRRRRGNRPVIESISRELQPCLETNLYAKPSKSARNLTEADRKYSVIEYLFCAIRLRLVFVHSNEPIEFFKSRTGSLDLGCEAKPARWHGHEFLLSARPGPLYILGTKGGSILGRRLAGFL